MRNCFVPGCDALCKKEKSVQRKMFLPPSKLFNQWADRLPKKRTFKAHDRVCERHFQENDIIQFWEANINGQMHLTPRDKPKLRENAVPCLNLPSKDDFPATPEEEMLKKRNQKIEILSQKIVAPAKRKLREKTEEVITKKSKKEERKLGIDINEMKVLVLADGETITTDENIASDVEPEQKIENQAEKLAMFENLYEEAFDVTLPSLLWGIHRDPDKKFVAYSEFDQLTMSFSKLLHFTDTCLYKSFINNKLISSKTLPHEQMTPDHVSALLDDLDKTAAS